MMAMQSKDSESVYRDQQYMKGEKEIIAADKAGSPQMKADKAALQIEEKLLRADKSKLNADEKR